MLTDYEININQDLSWISGWESLLMFVKNSILNGSKEVSLAAINCLQSTVVSHSPKVMTYFLSCLSCQLVAV